MTHLILDEVDTRTIDQDLLFLLVKLLFMDAHASSIINKRIIIMSGNLSQCQLLKYFSFLINNEAHSQVIISKIKAIQPFKVIYLEDFTREMPMLSAAAMDMVNTLQNHPATGRNIPHIMFDLVAEIILTQAHSGDIFLVFLPGTAEALQMESTLSAKPSLANFKVGLLLPHLGQKEQEKVLRSAPMHANIILATKFAERRIFIPRVNYVIDFGMEKVFSFDKRRGMNMLANEWTSKSSLGVRARKGSCNTVFRLFTKKTYEILKEDADIEMRKSCLSQPLLKIKALMCTLGPVDGLFQQLLDPPGMDSLTQTIKFLNEAGAIQGQSVGAFSLTQLGRLAVRLSLEVNVARLIVLGLLLCCSAECVIIAAGLTSSLDLFKRSYFQSGCKEELKVQENELSLFKAKKFYDDGMYSDMITLCNVYRHWLNAASWDTQWVSQTCVNKAELHILVGRVQFLASNLSMFMEEEQLVETMGREHKKILELRKGRTYQSQQHSWIFCEDLSTALLSITGAFNTNVMIGRVANTLSAQAESRDITMAGLNPNNTYKLINIPPKTLDDTEKFKEALQVLGSISKVLVLKDSNCALVECGGSLEEQQSSASGLPEAAQKAHFLENRKKHDGLKLTLKKGSKTDSLHMGSISREREVFWSTYVKGKKYGIINFDKPTNLPQYAFGLHTQEEFIIAVATKFIGADNSKVYVSTTTLLPAQNFFSITALLLFRPFQAYLIQTDSAQKRVYSMQYGPLVFHLHPHYVLIEQLHLIEEIRMKLNKRVLESQLCEGYMAEEILHLLTWVASQKHCEYHPNCALGAWQEYPTFKPIDIEKCSLAWKLNMTSRDRSVHTNNLDKGYTAHETQESCLLKALRMVEPDLGQQYLDEWLDGNKDLNPVFYSLLERLIANPELQEQAGVVLRFMHKKCDDLVPKKKRVQLEGWYHSLYNPVFLDEFSQNPAKVTRAQKIFLQRQQYSQQGIGSRAPFQLHEDYLPMVSKIMSLTSAQIKTLQQKVKHNANQVKILLPRSQSQTDNIVIFGHPAEVEAAIKWVDLVSVQENTRKLWQNSVNQTHFVPARQLDLICCTQLSPGDILYGETGFKGRVQFYVQGCIDKKSTTLQEMDLNLNQISEDIKNCIVRADTASEIEIQARLGRVVFACSQSKKNLLPFQRTQSLEKLLYSLGNKTFSKLYFSDTVTKEEYFHIKACLRLFKAVSIHQEKKITIFLKDPTDLEETSYLTKITIKDSMNKPGHFELAKLQQKERLAVIDLVQLEMRHVKADIRLSVQGLKDEHIDERYREFVSNIQWDGAKLKFPKGPFDIGQQRIKTTEEHAYHDFSVSLNEIAQVKGKTCLQKYEVEISPIYLGKSNLSVQDSVENLHTLLSKIVRQAHAISTHLCLSQPSSSNTVLAHAIMCLWRTGKREDSDLKSLLLHHVNNSSNLKQGFDCDQREELNALTQFDISSLVEILWEIDGSDFDGVNLSESLLSFLFQSLQSMKVVASELSNSRAQEIISRQGFPPRMAVAYASLFVCHCLGYYEWARILTPHLLELMIGKPQLTKEICFRNLNLLVTRTPFRSDLSLERLLSALGRHWADSNPKSFLQMYSLKIEQNCSTSRILIEDFVKKLFSRYPSEAAVFVLSAASWYINDLKKQKATDHKVSAPLIRLLGLIRDMKVIVTEDCRTLALNMLVSLEGMNDEVQEIEKKVFEIYEIDEATFRHCHYQKILSKSLSLKAIHLKELERRGLTYEYCQKMGLKSWTSGKHAESSCLIPGLNKEGNNLIGSPGIFIPARDPLGQILGAQIKVDQPMTGKYKWLSSNKVFKDGRRPSINEELPLFCCISSFSHMSILGMCEGGLKAHVLSFLGALPVIGASGAAFPKSKNLLEKYLAIINPDRIIFFPDAGSQCNDQVSRVYFQTFRLIREFGYSMLIAWWGQVNKMEHEDIDDLLCNGTGVHSIPVVSPLEFWHILHPAVRKKIAHEFPEYSGSSGMLEIKNQEAFVDEDEIEITRTFSMHQGNTANLYDEYLISIPKRIMMSMPPPPNDLVTPVSVIEFAIEIRTVKLLDNDIVDSCVDWMLQDLVKSTACLGLLCYYDFQCKPCLLELSVHQRCVLIQIPSFMDPQAVSIKLQTLLLDKDVVKAGVNIDKDVLHIYHFLHLTTNNCIKLSQHSAVNRHRAGLLDMFRTLFEWEWHQKAEVRHATNWRLNQMTLEQIKFAALSAWSCHLIWAQKKEMLDGQVKSFSLDEVPHELLDYFQRSLMSMDAVNNQSHTSAELTGATVEIQQGFLILNPNNVRSKALSPNSVVELSFKDGKEPEEYTAKRVGDKNVLVRKGAEKLQEPELDVTTISKLVVDNSKCLDMQQLKLGDAIYSLLCNPKACPSHILMGLGCLDMGCPANKETPFSPPQGLRLNRFQLDALRMMLSNPLCAVIGPPGTGKTRVIAGVAKTWEHSTTQGHILLCAAQQNVAVRHMAETMVQNKVQGVMLLISQDYYTDWRQEEYRHIEDHTVVSGPCTAGSLKAWTARNKRLAPRILLCTLALIGSSSFYVCMKNCNILYMIIDESSQAAEGTLVSSLICLPHLQRLSVLGDPRQLPPFGRSVQSVFDLVARNCKVMTLQVQYRMPKGIADFVSREFYGGILNTPSRNGAGSCCTPLVWVNVCGVAKTAVGSTSLCNEKEAEAIVMFCKMHHMHTTAAEVASSFSSSASSSSLPLSSSSLISSSSSFTSSPSSKPSKPVKLVVLTLYEAQRLLISKMLAENEVEGIPVHNVDSFQGQEAEIVLISLVVGARMSPFASDRRRACVLLSRARCALYIFGNLKAMKKCIACTSSEEPIIWKSLALECEEHGWVAEADNISSMDFSALT